MVAGEYCVPSFICSQNEHKNVCRNERQMTTIKWVQRERDMHIILSLCLWPNAKHFFGLCVRAHRDENNQDNLRTEMSDVWRRTVVLWESVLRCLYGDDDGIRGIIITAKKNIVRVCVPDSSLFHIEKPMPFWLQFHDTGLIADVFRRNFLQAIFPGALRFHCRNIHHRVVIYMVGIIYFI